MLVSNDLEVEKAVWTSVTPWLEVPNLDEEDMPLWLNNGYHMARMIKIEMSGYAAIYHGPGIQYYIAI